MNNRNKIQVRVFTLALLTAAGLIAPAAHSLAAETTPAAPTVISAAAVPAGDGPEDSDEKKDEDKAGNDDGSGSSDEKSDAKSDDSGNDGGNSNSSDDEQTDGDAGDDVPVINIGGSGSADGNDHAKPHKMSEKEKEAAKKAAKEAAKEAKKKREAQKKAAKLAAEKEKKESKKSADRAKKAAKAQKEAQKKDAKKAAKAKNAADARAKAAARAQAQRSARADDDPDGGGDGRDSSDSSDSFREAILDLSNRARHNAGCGSLKLGSNLNRSAQGKANDMAKHRYMDHTSPNGKDFDDNIRASGYKGNKTGENLGEGFKSADSVFSAWMHSPSHRANILDCKFKVLGVGSSDGYWVQHFGS